MKSFGHTKNLSLTLPFIKENIIWTPLIENPWHEPYFASYLREAADQKGAWNFEKKKIKQ